MENRKSPFFLNNSRFGGSENWQTNFKLDGLFIPEDPKIIWMMQGGYPHVMNSPSMDHMWLFLKMPIPQVTLGFNTWSSMTQKIWGIWGSHIFGTQWKPPSTA